MPDKDTEALPASRQRLLALSRWENEGGAVAVASEAGSSVDNEERARDQVTNSDKVVSINQV